MFENRITKVRKTILTSALSLGMIFGSMDVGFCGIISEGSTENIQSTQTVLKE